MVPAPDLLERDFTAATPDERWVADITEFAGLDGKLYLAGIRDLCDRTLAGWSMGERQTGKRQTTDLVVNALVMALSRRDPSERLLHHADHGARYTSVEFTNRLNDWGIIGSYGSVGDAYDNAAMESRDRTADTCARVAVAGHRLFAFASVPERHFGGTHQRPCSTRVLGHDPLSSTSRGW